MPRYFAPITTVALSEKIDAAIGKDEDGVYGFIDKLDLKVKFDLENHEIAGHANFGPKELMGYKLGSSGLTYCGCCAGGDWEFPVFFIIYWDGKRLRAYVPTDGNPWNTATKQAFGNDDEADLKNAKKRWPKAFEGKTADDLDMGSDFDFDPKAIRADIAARILPAPVNVL